MTVQFFLFSLLNMHTPSADMAAIKQIGLDTERRVTFVCREYSAAVYCASRILPNSPLFGISSYSDLLIKTYSVLSAEPTM